MSGPGGQWHGDQEGSGGSPAVPPQWQQERGGGYRPPRYQDPRQQPWPQEPQAYPRPQYQAPGPQFSPVPPPAPPRQPPSRPAPAPQPPARPKPPAAPKAKPKADGKPSAKGCGCLAGLLAAAALLVWFLVSVYGGSGGSSPPAAAPATTSAAQARAQAQAKAKASAEVNACYARPPASGDIYVRTVIPGDATEAQELGGEYSWDYVTGQCLNSVDSTVAGAADGPGDCTTVAYKADNPGYDVNEVPAPPLNDVLAEAGPGC